MQLNLKIEAYNNTYNATCMVLGYLESLGVFLFL